MIVPRTNQNTYQVFTGSTGIDRAINYINYSQSSSSKFNHDHRQDAHKIQPEAEAAMPDFNLSWPPTYPQQVYDQSADQPISVTASVASQDSSKHSLQPVLG